MSKGRQLNGKIDPKGDVGTREEMLQILTEMARNGSVSAATTLVRELRADEDAAKNNVGQAIDRIMTKANGVAA